MAYCGKGSVCITLTKRSQLRGVVNVTNKENFDFAEALESVYPLLEIVFSYLDFNDLQVAAKVKPSWQLTAKKVLAKRNQISWISVFRKKKPSFLNYSTNFSYSNVEFGIILFNYRVISLSDSFCCHNSSRSSFRKVKFSDFLAEQVAPKDVTYCIVACPAVTSVFSKGIMNKTSVPLFDSCFLPTIPNVRISMFYCNPKNMRNDLVQENEELKCLLFFCKGNLGTKLYTIIEKMFPGGGIESCAVGGGIIKNTIAFPRLSSPHKHNSREFDNLCIAFAEDKSCESVFDAASVVISGNDLTVEEFEDKLLEFKKRIVIRSQSVAFRICCAAKTKKSHENRIFSKLFPDVPLLGLEAEGEIGWNCFNVSSSDEDEDEPQEPKKLKRTSIRYPIIQHQWSTIIVFMTWGNLLRPQE